MRRLVTIVLSILVLGGIGWAVIAELETQPTASDEPPAIVLMAPDGFNVRSIGEATFEAAATALRASSDSQAGVEYIANGDRIIFLADRDGQRIVEMRAARSGTIVERVWPEEVGRRLDWAIEHGNMEVPGLPPATGKNLYH